MQEDQATYSMLLAYQLQEGVKGLETVQECHATYSRQWVEFLHVGVTRGRNSDCGPLDILESGGLAMAGRGY